VAEQVRPFLGRPLEAPTARRPASLDALTAATDIHVVKYDDFKAAFCRALDEAGIPVMGSTDENLDLRSMDRRYEVCIEPVGPQDVEPWFVSGKICWNWGSVHTARTASREEDMLVELFGREDAHEMDTRKPALRVDVEMQANLPWGKAIPMPKPHVWASWADEVMTRLEEIERVVPEETSRETSDGMLEILAWQGEPIARVLIAPGGELKLEAIKVTAFQMLELPRIFDDPDRDDDHPRDQLVALFKRVKAAMHAWKDGIDHLRLPGTKQ
jgi:hypothetical protein